MSDAQHGPAPCGRRPRQPAVGPHPVRQVLDTAGVDPRRGILLRAGVLPVQIAEGPARLRLPAVLPRGGIEFQRPEGHVMAVRKRHPVAGRGKGVGAGERNRRVVLRVARRNLGVQHPPPRTVRRHGLHRQPDPRLVAAGMVDAVHARQLDGADHDRLGERDLEPHGVARRAGRKSQRLAVRSCDHFAPGQVVPALHGHGPEPLARVVERRREGQHRNVAVVAPRLAVRHGNLRISFKYELLKQILENATSKEITFSMGDCSKAVIIKPVGEDDKIDNLSLLVPMMLDA